MILDVARELVLERGVGLDEAQTLQVLQLPDEAVDSRVSRRSSCASSVSIATTTTSRRRGCTAATS